MSTYIFKGQRFDESDGATIRMIKADNKVLIKVDSTATTNKADGIIDKAEGTITTIAGHMLGYRLIFLFFYMLNYSNWMYFNIILNWIYSYL